VQLKHGLQAQEAGTKEEDGGAGLRKLLQQVLNFTGAWRGLNLIL